MTNLTTEFLLGISDRTLQRRIEDGIIRPKKIGREYQITPSDLEKLKTETQ